MGCFDGNPAHLHPLPHVEAGRKYVEYMGGADALLAKAREAYAKGEYRWVAQVVNHLVFAEDNEQARSLQADALEQLGYQTENATWRNFYLSGAMELRDGVKEAQIAGTGAAPLDIVACLGPEMIFDAMAVHLNGPKAAGKKAVINLRFTDTGQEYHLLLENSVLNHGEGALEGADVTMSLPRATLDAIVAGAADPKAAFGSGAVSVEGDGGKLGELFSLLDADVFWFNIVTP